LKAGSRNENGIVRKRRGRTKEKEVNAKERPVSGVGQRKKR